jgi:hypothetical protein
MYKKFLLVILPMIVVGIFLVLPHFVQAQTTIVPCDGVVVKCGFTSFITLIQNIITFAIKYIIIPVGAIIFAYVGFLFLTSGGSAETRKKAKNIFIKVVIGIVVILAAWLIVSTILTVFGVTDSFRFLK